MGSGYWCSSPSAAEGLKLSQLTALMNLESTGKCCEMLSSTWIKCGVLSISDIRPDWSLGWLDDMIWASLQFKPDWLVWRYAIVTKLYIVFNEVWTAITVAGWMCVQKAAHLIFGIWSWLWGQSWIYHTGGLATSICPVVIVVILTCLRLFSLTIL